MAQYTEKIVRQVTITENGAKNVREQTIVYRDGKEIGRSNHRYAIAPDADVPQVIADHIEQKKGKQPKG